MLSAWRSAVDRWTAFTPLPMRPLKDGTSVPTLGEEAGPKQWPGRLTRRRVKVGRTLPPGFHILAILSSSTAFTNPMTALRKKGPVHSLLYVD